MTETYLEYTKHCMFCGKEHKFLIPQRAARLWEGYTTDSGLYVHGIPIQLAWPESTPAQREKAISGTCDDCWDLHMNTDDDD